MNFAFENEAQEFHTNLKSKMQKYNSPNDQRNDAIDILKQNNLEINEKNIEIAIELINPKKTIEKIDRPAFDCKS